jgi:hypothetical protein
MRRSLFVLLLLAAGVVHAQIEPGSWYGFYAWLNSFNASDAAQLEEYLRQKSCSAARMHQPFNREAAFEMELRARVGGGLTRYKFVSYTETKMHAILKGLDNKSWAEVTLQFTREGAQQIVMLSLRQIDSPEAVADESAGSDVAGGSEDADAEALERACLCAPVPRRLHSASSGPTLPSPKLLSPKDGAVFDYFPRKTTVHWDAVPGAAGYLLQWDYHDSGGWHGNAKIPLAQVEVTETTYTFEFVGAQPGHWRVSAFDERGAIGIPSEWRQFRYLQ